jgi:hypothetical protein
MLLFYCYLPTAAESEMKFIFMDTTLGLIEPRSDGGKDFTLSPVAHLHHLLYYSSVAVSNLI